MTTRPFVFLIPFLLQLGKHIANQVCFYLLQLCKSNFPLLTGAFTAAQASLQCFTCGLPDIPTDVPTQNKTRQLGNSCEQFLNETGTQESQKFLTQCPPETLSCYNARGSMISGYDEENSLNYHYMGCSEVKDLPFKTGCHKTKHVAKRRPEMVSTNRYQICTFVNTFILSDWVVHWDLLLFRRQVQPSGFPSYGSSSFFSFFCIFDFWKLRQPLPFVSEAGFQVVAN